MTYLAIEGGKSDKEIVLLIQQILSGKEWNNDTLEAIADLLQANGYTIEEP